MTALPSPPFNCPIHQQSTSNCGHTFAQTVIDFVALICLQTMGRSDFSRVEVTDTQRIILVDKVYKFFFETIFRNRPQDMEKSRSLSESAVDCFVIFLF
jgi:hypothetical protein